MVIVEGDGLTGRRDLRFDLFNLQCIFHPLKIDPPSMKKGMHLLIFDVHSNFWNAVTVSWGSHYFIMILHNVMIKFHYVII